MLRHKLLIASAPVLALVAGTAMAQPPASPAQDPLLPEKKAGAQQVAIFPQVTGRWVGGLQNPANGEVSNSFQFELTAEGGKLTGSMITLVPFNGARGFPIQAIKDGLISGASISFLTNFGANDQKLAGEVKGDSLILTRQNSSGVFLPNMVLKRVSPGRGGIGVTATGGYGFP